MIETIDMNDHSLYAPVDDETFTAITTLTSNIKLDDVIDLIDIDRENAYFKDYENDCAIPFKDGVAILFEAISYPCQHDGLNLYQGGLLIDLFKKHFLGDDAWYRWYLSDEK